MRGRNETDVEIRKEGRNFMDNPYLLILASSLLACGMSAFRKEYQRRKDATLKSTVSFMLISSLFVVLVGIVYGAITNFAIISNLDGVTFALAVAFALILTVNTCLCIFAAKYGSLAIVSTFATLGTLVISTFYGLISNPTKNKLGVFSIIGLVLAVSIIVLSFIQARKRDVTDKEEKKLRDNKKFLSFCIAIFFFNGSALSVYSLFTENRAEYGGLNFIFLYLFLCVVLCALILGAIALFTREKSLEQAERKNKTLDVKPTLCALGYGVLSISSEFCAITTTSLLPIVIQAPLSFAVSVIIVAIVDYLIYKQKLTKIQLVQMGLAIVCAVCFAL